MTHSPSSSVVDDVKSPTKPRGMFATALFSAMALIAGSVSLIAAPMAATADQVEIPESEERLVFDSGHTDMFNLSLDDDGEIALNLKEDITGQHVIQDPDDVALRVKDSAKTELPEGFVGDGSPSEGYALSLTQDKNLIWPGWDTLETQNEYHSAEFEIKSVTGLDGEDAPGTIFLGSSTAFGESVSLLSDNGFTLPGTIPQKEPAHTHANWVFSDPGTYVLTVQATATSEDGSKTSTSEEKTYVIAVGDDAEIPAVGSTDAPGEEGPEQTEPASPSETESTPPSPSETETDTETPSPSQTDTTSPSTSAPTSPSPKETDTDDDGDDTDNQGDKGQSGDETCWDEHVFDSGHVDAFNLALSDSKPVLTLKEDVTGSHVQHDP